MIKKTLEYIVGLNKPELVEVGGETYSDKSLHRVNTTRRRKAFGCTL